MRRDLIMLVQIWNKENEEKAKVLKKSGHEEAKPVKKKKKKKPARKAKKEKKGVLSQAKQALLKLQAASSRAVLACKDDVKKGHKQTKADCKSAERKVKQVLELTKKWNAKEWKHSPKWVKKEEYALGSTLMRFDITEKQLAGAALALAQQKKASGGASHPTQHEVVKAVEQSNTLWESATQLAKRVLKGKVRTKPPRPFTNGVIKKQDMAKLKVDKKAEKKLRSQVAADLANSLIQVMAETPHGPPALFQLLTSRDKTQRRHGKTLMQLMVGAAA